MQNQNLEKISFTLGGAGDSADNPILSGLPLSLQVRFDRAVKQVAGLIGATFPPTTPLAFVVDPGDALLFRHNAVAGISPFIVGKLFIRVVFTSTLTGQQTYWDKQIFIAVAPADAIQVWDTETMAWVSVNYDTAPTVVPLCAQMAGIRFFTGWYDEFRLPRYGGANLVSVYDWGTAESDTARLDVKRDLLQDLSAYRCIYLEKHEIATIETHDVAVAFRTSEAGAAVVFHIRLRTVSCFGFEIQDPVTLEA